MSGLTLFVVTSTNLWGWRFAETVPEDKITVPGKTSTDFSGVEDTEMCARRETTYVSRNYNVGPFTKERGFESGRQYGSTLSGLMGSS